ncbi:hypothetical protein [Yoonia sp. 2307UL14-13]|uniref:hypothetical protein n=1 Tax=Yoonia sp. 2307UL14-13 TaxID=3126506 RepID=UPI0030B23F77
MTYIELNAFFQYRPMQFDDGVSEFFELLTRLQSLRPLSLGWEGDGHALSTDPDGLRSILRDANDPDGPEGSFSFAMAENARSSDGQSHVAGQYLATLRFDREEGELSFRLKIVPHLSSATLFRDIIKILHDWWPLQHVHVDDPFYAKYDRPLDPTNRAGIGWAGWVPFQLTPAQVPEAQILAPLGNGTFLATQETYWETTDRDAVKRAQDLEIRLNNLGMLPTMEALRQGIWPAAR